LEAAPGLEPGMTVLQTEGTPPGGRVNTGAYDGILPQLTAQLTEIAPELAAIIRSWPKLPEAMRAGILAMVKAVQP